MRLSLNNFNNRALLLEEIIKEKEVALAKAPEGTLRVACTRRFPQYFHRTDRDQNNGIYITRKDISLAKALAQKDYDAKVLEAAERELNTLTKLIARYNKGVAEDVYEKLSPARRELVTPIMMTDEEFVKKWLEEPYDRPGFEEGAPEYYSDRGIRVRSKSEVGIYNKYDDFGIPAKYEVPLYLKGFRWVNPDFRVLNVRLRKEFIHEHLGKMDDPAYLFDNIAKINAYMKNGYFPGKNLILTFETKSQPFDQRMMDEIIKQYLL